MEQYFNEDYFNDYVYKEEFGDYDLIKSDFIEFTHIFNSHKELSYILYKNQLSKDDIEKINTKFNINSLAVIKNRLKKEDIITVTATENKKEWVTLSDKGLEELNLYISKEFITKNKYIQKYLKKQRQNKTDLILNDVNKHKELIRDFFSFADNKPNFHLFLKNDFIVFSIIDILEHSVELGDFILENFELGYKLIQECVKEIIVDEKEYNQMKDNIKIVDVDKIKSQFYELTTIPKGTKELIYIKGILAKKKRRIVEKAEWFNYYCTNPGCSHSEDKLRATTELKACPRCKSGLDLDNIDTKKVHYLELKDLKTDIGIDLAVKDEMINEINQIQLGENVTVSGFVDSKIIKDQKTKETFFEKEFVVNNISLSDSSTYITEEDKKQVEKLLEKLKKDNIRPIEWLIKDFRDNFPYPLQAFTFALLPQVLKYKMGEENIIHTLFMGSPDTGKTTFLKTLGLIFPKNKSIQLNQLSEAKFYGTVNSEGLNDIGLIMSLRDGSLILDEIDKDILSFDKSANMLNELLEEQKGTKEKAGISIRVENVNLRVYGIMNPDSSEKLDSLQWAVKKMHESTLTRFFFINVDSFIKNPQKEFIIENDTKGGLSKVFKTDFSLHQKVILYLRDIEVDLSQVEKQLIGIQKAIRSTSAQFTELASRNIKQIKNIVKALTRLNGRESATIEELQEAIELMKFMFETRGDSLETAGRKLQEALYLK